MKKALFLLFTLFSLFNVHAQDKKAQQWVDSVYKKMTNKERIAQLMIIRVPSEDKSKYYTQAIENIEKYKVGGICFFAGTSDKQLKLLSVYKQKSTTPLLISIDGESGLGMRLKDVPSFPQQMLLGALQNDSLMYEMGRLVGLQCKKMGIQINYAPVADINSDPKNPVIGMRSFGEDKKNVARKSLAYLRGLRDAGVLPVPKHFPGHGDTDVDSHTNLPIISHTKEYMDSVDLYPFKRLIDSNTPAIMVGHLEVPAYDSITNMPASLSYNIITKLLREKLKYKGLIFTDGLDMGSVTKYYKNGLAELKALQAGNDILLLPNDVPSAVNLIDSISIKDTLLQASINEKCKKVLYLKYDFFVQNKKSFDKPTQLNKQDFWAIERIRQEASDRAVTIVKNDNSLLPIKKPSDFSIACISTDMALTKELKEKLDAYTKIDHYILPNKFSMDSVQSVLQKLSNYNCAIITLPVLNSRDAKNKYGVPDSYFSLIEQIQHRVKNNILLVLGSPYVLSYVKDSNLSAVVVGYQNIPNTERALAEAVFGGLPIQGKLSVSADSVHLCNTGIETKKIRLGYKLPSQLGLSQAYFDSIDYLAAKGIKEKAYPGCQILVAKDGYIIHNKSYGTLTYEGSSKVNQSTVYDLASVTKVAATTMAVMKLYENKQIDLDDKLSKYLPYLQQTDKDDITIKQALSHFARLKAFVPFWTETVSNNTPDFRLYAYDKSDSLKDYVHVCDSLCIVKNYRSEILHKIANTKLLDSRVYLYSDFGFILLGDLVEKVSGKTLDAFVQETYYKELGMNNTSFNPIAAGFDRNNIAPTERDLLFRKMQITGYVHDPTAAMMGGVAGHAGLFSTATDLAKLLEMLLEEGTYGSETYLNSNTIDVFNHRYYQEFDNRRGLGFDKPLINGNSSHVNANASQESYGHSGFTGTYFWVDPDKQLIYIFLSNRVYPDAENKKIQSLNIRTQIHGYIYKAIQNK